MFVSPTNPYLVKLVGAGPGDPELLTIKALKAIQEAQVLLIDDLVSQEICALANPKARIIYVGKRGGCKSTPQAFIEKLLIQEAKAGHNVVRLKGGDPFIFGRGGEEVEHLQSAGVRVEVINGITSGLAAVSSLNVSLTHRDNAQGVIFLTGHQQAYTNTSDSQIDHAYTKFDWSLIGRTAECTKLTLVIYMGIKGAKNIQSGLLQTMPYSTPVAIIQNASLANQINVFCTLQDLHKTITDQGLTSPCVIIVGNVLKGITALREDHTSTCENTKLVATALPKF
jgi:uroporphyrin-III C-methyltransferase